MKISSDEQSKNNDVAFYKKNNVMEQYKNFNKNRIVKFSFLKKGKNSFSIDKNFSTSINSFNFRNSLNIEAKSNLITMEEDKAIASHDIQGWKKYNIVDKDNKFPVKQFKLNQLSRISNNKDNSKNITPELKRSKNIILEEVEQEETKNNKKFNSENSTTHNSLENLVITNSNNKSNEFSKIIVNSSVHQVVKSINLNPIKKSKLQILRIGEIENQNYSGTRNLTNLDTIIKHTSIGNSNSNGFFRKSTISKTIVPKVKLAPLGCNYDICTQNIQKNVPSPRAKQIENKKYSMMKNIQIDCISEQDPKIFKFHSVRSKEGQSKNGTKKVNQDSFLVMTSILDIENFSLYGIFDGHGINGHYVSDFTKNYFNKFFSRSELYYIPRNTSLISGLSSLKNAVNESEIYSKFVNNQYELIREAFNSIENEIKGCNFDVNFSGSTACFIALIRDKLVCANVGDSRCIIVNSTESNSYNIHQITNDHKPDVDFEKERILKQGGVVEQSKEFGMKIGPARVWVKDETYPGLAMSRSIGDFVAKSIGVSCKPDIFEIDITSSTKFVILASDGIWDILSNEKVTEIVNKYYNTKEINKAVEALISEATNCWIEEDKNIDDITVIIIFFNTILF